MRFWAQVEPALPSMVSVTQAQRGSFTEPASTAVSYDNNVVVFIMIIIIIIDDAPQSITGSYSCLWP